MRKVYAILLLSVFLAYHLGYLGVYWYTTHNINNYWKSKIQFNGPKKELTLPITLPYWVDNEGYRSTDGEININGISYRKVLQKYEDDSIHLIIVPDGKSIEAKSIMASWIGMLSDEQSKESGSLRLLVNSAKDFNLNADHHNWLVETLLFRFRPYITGNFISPLLLPDTPPPNYLA